MATDNVPQSGQEPIRRDVSETKARRQPFRKHKPETKSPEVATVDETQHTPSPTTTLPHWYEFLQSADDSAVKARFVAEASAILAAQGEGLSHYCFLSLLDTHTSISDFDLDRIFAALRRSNADKKRDVLLFLLSPGGRIEPAYQMSKLCKAYSSKSFAVAVPRQAKSAATLLAMGADEIHLGPLGHLGPIDPQLGGLPALGVSQALKSIADLADQHPGSSEMFSKYLKLVLTVEQIGYYERICQSATQYAERLLSTKTNLPSTPAQIASELVYEYKDHGFVIDLDEARKHLGAHWIRTGTLESLAAEQIYSLYESVSLFLGIHQKKQLMVVGGFEEEDVMILKRPRR